MEIRLNGPGMTALHKVGLAGLYMTLRALEDENGGEPRLKGGSWERQSDRVRLEWEDSDVFFPELFRRSFRIDEQGLFWFPAMGAPLNHPQLGFTRHQALLATFLQHGQTRKAESAAKKSGNLTITFDSVSYSFVFQRVSQYQHQIAAFNPKGDNVLAGWLFPGAVVRHTGFGQKSTAIEESPERALVLRYAPIGAVFFRLRPRVAGIRPTFALVLPDLGDLELYADLHESIAIQNPIASGSADAGLRVLTELHSRDLLHDIESTVCRVISFGTVPWATQQKTRVHLKTVKVRSERDMTVFRAAMQLFPPRLVAPKQADAEPFWSVPQIPDLIAENVIDGKQWWHGFADFVAGQQRRDHVFAYERKGLMTMVEHADTFPEGPERTFVRACHEAWRRRLGQISDKAKRQGGSFTDQANREFTRLRTTFARCKNADTLREAVTDFWARGGYGNTALQDSWHEVIPLLDEKRWRLARDLALLALASYKPQSKEQRDAMAASVDASESDHEGDDSE